MEFSRLVQVGQWKPSTRWTVGVLAVLLLVGLSMLFLDPTVGRWANSIADNPAVDNLRLALTPLGREPIQGLFILALLAAAAVLRARVYARIALIVGLVYALSGSACHCIKVATHRPRPEVMVLPWAHDYGLPAALLDNEIHSFPSGDVTIASGLAGVAFLALGGWRGRYLVFLIPLLSSVGRITGAKHYPSDCLAGWLVGYACACWVWSCLGPRPKQEGDGQATPERVTTSS